MDVRQLVSIFYHIDDLCKELDQYSEHYLLTRPTKGKRGPAGGLVVSEIMTILVIFQMPKFRDFKNFYSGFLAVYHKDYFPGMPSYEKQLLNQRGIIETVIEHLKTLLPGLTYKASLNIQCDDSFNCCPCCLCY